MDRDVVIFNTRAVALLVGGTEIDEAVGCLETVREGVAVAGSRDLSSLKEDSALSATREHHHRL